MFQNVQLLRKHSCLSPGEVAKQLEITEKVYIRYELDEGKIPVEILVKLAQFYHVSVDYLLGLTPDPSPHFCRH